MAMESTASPSFENLPKKEMDQSKSVTEIGVGGEHEYRYEIDFTDDDEEEDDDNDDSDDDEEGYCYVIDHGNPGEHYVASHLGVIEDEGYENGDEDEYDDSDYDDNDNESDDDDSCYEIVPTAFSPKISLQVPNAVSAT